MPIPKDNSKLEAARKLRREMTPHERKLWYLFLRKYPVKIYKQRIVGTFIVDFFCASAKLVIEIDGAQHQMPENRDADAMRDAYFQSLGIAVKRYTNHDINRNFRAVCEDLLKTVGVAANEMKK